MSIIQHLQLSPVVNSENLATKQILGIGHNLEIWGGQSNV